MPIKFLKIKDCGCVVKAILCSITQTDKGTIYSLGSHEHFTECNKCKKEEDNEIDKLHDMWINDNITDDFGYSMWKETKFL